MNGISGSSNDYQAVTIEVACEAKHPYAITEKAMAALIELCTDICRRNGIKKLLWSGDKNLVGNPAKQNLTVHRWFANKACPGDYIYQRLGDIAAKVNAKLGATGAAPVQPSAPVSSVPYKVRITASLTGHLNGNSLVVVGGARDPVHPDGDVDPVHLLVAARTPRAVLSSSNARRIRARLRRSSGPDTARSISTQLNQRGHGLLGDGVGVLGLTGHLNGNSTSMHRKEVSTPWDFPTALWPRSS